jgi:hypothetical protein
MDMNVPHRHVLLTLLASQGRSLGLCDRVVDRQCRSDRLRGKPYQIRLAKTAKNVPFWLAENSMRKMIEFRIVAHHVLDA